MKTNKNYTNNKTTRPNEKNSTKNHEMKKIQNRDIPPINLDVD